MNIKETRGEVKVVDKLVVGQRQCSRGEAACLPRDFKSLITRCQSTAMQRPLTNYEEHSESAREISTQEFDHNAKLLLIFKVILMTL